MTDTGKSQIPASSGAIDEAEVEALAAAWPRILIAAGEAERIARWWCEMRREAVAQGGPNFAQAAISEELFQVLFETRRARRLIRGFEAAEEALAAEAAGLRRAPATRSAGERRISRVLVLTEDGAPRLYRNAEGLRRRYADRLEVLVIKCDEMALGEAVFGAGQRVRAVLMDHKEAVVDLLATVALGGELETAEQV